MSITYQSAAPQGSRFEQTLGSFAQEDGLPLADSLSDEEVEQVIQQAPGGHPADFGNTPNAIYTPKLVLWGLLSQVISDGIQRSCQAAVHRIIVLCLCRQLQAPSPDTSAYCRARAKMPLAVVRSLTLNVADDVEKHIPRRWLWHGRRVLIVDGTTVTVADTVENQQAWPQQRSQKEGLGFPIMRVVAVFHLSTGMVGNMAEGPYQGKETGETALLRELLDSVRPGDRVPSGWLADCHYCSYLMIALLLKHGADVVMKLHHRRQFDFSEGERLGNGDILVTWDRPEQPEWMDDETYESIDEQLTIRLTEVHVHVKGFRTRKYVSATTLTDVREYPAAPRGYPIW